MRNRKTFEKYLELANISCFFFPFLSIVPWECQNESSVCDDGLQLWIAACRLNSLKVMRHTGTCSVHFEGDPGRTKFHPVS